MVPIPSEYDIYTGNKRRIHICAPTAARVLTVGEGDQHALALLLIMDQHVLSKGIRCSQQRRSQGKVSGAALGWGSGF